MKKKHIFILIFIIILIAILAFVGHKIYKTYFCSTEISSRDNSFKLTIPNRIKYKVKDSNDENYTLDLYSVKDEMFLYSTVINKKSEINLEETVKNEEESVSKTLSNFNNILDVQKHQFKTTIHINMHIPIQMQITEKIYMQKLYGLKQTLKFMFWI